MLVRAWHRTYGGAGHHLQLLEQLRSPPARREVHPAPDHQHPAGRAPQALRRRGERARLDPRRRPLERGVGRPRAREGGGDLPRGRRRGEEQPRGPARDPRGHGPAGGRLRPGARPPGATTAATPSTPPRYAGSWAGAPSAPTSPRGWPGPSSGTGPTRRGGRRPRTPPRRATPSRGCRGGVGMAGGERVVSGSFAFTQTSIEGSGCG